ncbi:MAG: bifunctional 4-hydroxy-2-oxoglutarate aldolase/2-dehydro-3-deoxy-phosphogluconate aldolase [Acidobacteria bacterium]|nr:bifunctional 4-hydroxy-2-oxoglutarate aldolase/2-dehydro-3-deoxy-phosphogluconate aldolase [Acidobacteriota bacterium]MBI3424218.1 bifunctional 4-hydroxy-2-oxoglutarate aldolase/2-dehydro-3-deoxy-phosphogluconate aldolase [Acidobacteriota bacterium]
MNTSSTFEQIAAGRLIAILRGDFGGRESELVTVLHAAGLTAVEVTLNSPNALTTIQRLAAQFGARMAIGAGTVLTVAEVAQAVDVGARFIVSPNRNAAVIAATKQRGLVSLPGCFTPSEIVEALDAGADAIKIFPANTLGPTYVKAVRAPLTQARLVPTGGVTPEQAREYLAAGAWALGIGSELVGKDVWQAGNFELLQRRAAEFVSAVKESAPYQ